MLECTVFQVSGTASAMVQGLGREGESMWRIWSIKPRLCPSWCRAGGGGVGERQSGKRQMI